MLEPVSLSPACPTRNGPVAQVLSARLVSQREAEAGRVIERRAERLQMICLQRRHKDRPIAVVTITVGNQGVERQLAGERVECAKCAWKPTAGRYREPG